MKLLRRGSLAGRESGRLKYVAYPSRRVIWLVLFITVCSALDALLEISGDKGHKGDKGQVLQSHIISSHPTIWR